MTIEHDGKLCMWTVFERPADAPDQYVARLFELDQPTATAICCDTLEEIREVIARLYPGLTCLPRSPNDEPQIVEVWL
jgi:hypothetical protein